MKYWRKGADSQPDYCFSIELIARTCGESSTCTSFTRLYSSLDAFSAFGLASLTSVPGAEAMSVTTLAVSTTVARSSSEQRPPSRSGLQACWQSSPEAGRTIARIAPSISAFTWIKATGCSSTEQMEVD